jgi:hypothetical protein
MVSLNEIWQDFDECAAIASNVPNVSHMSMVSRTSCSDTDEACYSSDDNSCRSKALLVNLPNGDVHVCGGKYRCEYMIPNDERLMVCSLSGRVYDSEKTDEYYDLNGGRGLHTHFDR